MILGFVLLFFLMRRRPPRSTRTDTLFPYTTLFRSRLGSLARHFRRYPGNDADFPKYPPARTIAIRHSTPTRSTAAMMPANKPIALTRFLIEEQRAGRINADLRLLIEEIGRASCRESVCQYV